MQEMRVQLLGGEEPLEKEMATHSSISCLGNPMDRGAWRATYSPQGRKELDRLSNEITTNICYTGLLIVRE